MTHELPKLNYKYDALEPHFDARTMEIHHSKHHAGYTAKFNTALEGSGLENKDPLELLSKISAIPEDIRKGIVNNGGGYVNHALFWEILSPEQQQPKGKLKEAIDLKFGSLEIFQELFSTAAATTFGSGWAWLVVDKGELEITTTANQDTPISQGKKPILLLDVWEHSYYLKYQNLRPDYIKAFWNIVNWKKVEELFDATQ